jgi:iron(III) transport system permease protein
MVLGVDVYPTVVFARLGGMDFAPGEAAVFMLPLVAAALTLAVLERRFAGRRAIATIASIRHSGRPLFSFGVPLLIGPVVAAAMSLAPIAALIFASDLGDGLIELRRWIGDTPWNSSRSSAAAAVMMTVVAVVLGREIDRRTRIGTWSDTLSTITFLMPSSILGVGIVAAWNRAATGWLYGTFAILVIGFVARYAAVAIRTYAAALTQIPPSLDEAARVAGASYLTRFGLMLGMTPRGIAGAFFLALIFALRDLETAVLYYPPGGQPLTVRLFTLEANGPPGVVAALAVLHVALTLAAVASGGLVLRVLKK